MNYVPLINVTTVAIALPTLVLASLIIVAAGHSRCSPWQCPEQNHLRSESRELNRVRIFKTLAGEAVIYVIAFIFGALMYRLCSQHLSWQFLVASDRNWLMRSLIPDATNLFFSVWTSLPIVAFLQIRFLRVSMRTDFKSLFYSGQFIFCVSVLMALLFWGLPLMLWVFTGSGSSFVDSYVARDLVRIGIAFATLPMSIAGMAVALSGISVDKNERKRTLAILESTDFSHLDRQTDEELQVLVGMALKAKKLDFADRFSKELLHRIEHSSE